MYARQTGHASEKAHFCAFAGDVRFQPSRGAKLNEHVPVSTPDRTTLPTQCGSALACSVGRAVRRHLGGDALLLRAAQIEGDRARELPPLRRRKLGQQWCGPQFQLLQVVGHSHALVGSAGGSAG